MQHRICERFDVPIVFPLAQSVIHASPIWGWPWFINKTIPFSRNFLFQMHRGNAVSISYEEVHLYICHIVLQLTFSTLQLLLAIFFREHVSSSSNLPKERCCPGPMTDNGLLLLPLRVLSRASSFMVVGSSSMVWDAFPLVFVLSLFLHFFASFSQLTVIGVSWNWHVTEFWIAHNFHHRSEIPPWRKNIKDFVEKREGCPCLIPFRISYYHVGYIMFVDIFHRLELLLPWMSVNYILN